MKQKLKTYKAAAKRLKFTSRGVLLRRRSALNHLRRHKSARAVRSMDKYRHVSTADAPNMRKLVPQGKGKGQ